MVVVRLFGVGRADHDEASARTEHVDRSAVEIAEHARVEHLIGLSEHEAPAREIEDAVDAAQHRVDVVRDEQDRGIRLASVTVDERDHRLLVGEVETREGLVAQQDARVVGERLADAQALLLATREQAHGAVGEVLRPDRADQRVHALAIGAPREGDAPLVPVHTERDEVAPAQRRIARQRARLRNVADPPVSLGADRSAERRDRSGRQRLEPQDGAQQRRLARAARAEDRDELSRLDGEVEPGPEFALASTQGGVFDPQQGVRHSSSASWIAAMLSCIHER